MEFKVKKHSFRQKVITFCMLLGIVFSMSATVLYLLAEKNLTRSALKKHRALVIDLGKENIAVGSLHNSLKKRIAVDKKDDNAAPKQEDQQRNKKHATASTSATSDPLEASIGEGY